MFFTPHLFAFKDFARMSSEVTEMKITEEEIKDIGRLIYTLGHLFNRGEGASRKEDHLPERFYTEPTPLGPDTNRGKVIEREK
jgi:aldehyde:ferredoxin oxidoreductase